MQTPPRPHKNLPGITAEQIVNVTPTKPKKSSSESSTIDLSHKRSDYLVWDDYFMAVAFLSAQRSKDPNSQVGACIVNEERKIVGIGYNGMPNGCSDDALPWRRSDEDWLETKYPYVCHAELNAIMNKNSADVKGCTMYVALFPCNECAKVIIQSGLHCIVYLSDKYHEKPAMKASRRMLDHAGVKYRQFTPTNGKVLIDFYALDPEARPTDENCQRSPSNQCRDTLITTADMPL